MDRVFEPLEGSAARSKTLTATALGEKQKQNPSLTRWKLTTPIALMVGFSLAAAVAGMFSILLWRSWIQARQDLNQERQLLVLERLRQLGPISPPNPSLIQLPPPEPQLSAAESSWFEAPAPIRVPIPANTPAAQAPPPTPNQVSSPITNPASMPMPELLGVVQVPGRGGTAIFNTTTGSVTAAIGENIGSSGWQLQSVANDQAQIIRQGIVRVLSLSSR